MQIFSNENEFDLCENQCVGEIHFFLLRLVLINTMTTGNWEMAY